MGRKAVSPICRVMHIKEHLSKREGVCPGVPGLSAAYCATAPCKPLHGALDVKAVDLNTNIVPHSFRTMLYVRAPGASLMDMRTL